MNKKSGFDLLLSDDSDFSIHSIHIKDEINIITNMVWMDGWIKKGGSTSDRIKTPARGALFGPNVLP
jgi:hypothetical protein